MKSRIYTLLLILCFSISTFAQKATFSDKELSALVDIVKMLRTSNETNFNKATQVLKSDTKWTMMDETGAVRADKECKASDKVPGFKLNRILSKVSGGRKYVATHGDMVNGEDTRYNYSLYERALKPGVEVAYRLKGREGKQTFVIVPFKADAKFEVAVKSNGKTVSSSKKNPDGTVVVEWTKNTPSKTLTFDLVVKNGSKDSQSFVIINHNTRNK